MICWNAGNVNMVCKCGYQNHKDAKYCANCHRRLKKTNWVTVALISAIVLVAGILLGVLTKGCSTDGPDSTEPKPTQQAHTHSWKGATCITPKTCKLCGITSGSSLGHSFKDASCTEPKTCTICGTTSGEKLGHQWIQKEAGMPIFCIHCGIEQPFEESYLNGGQMHNGEEFYMDSYEFLIIFTTDLRYAGFSGYDFECMEHTGNGFIYEIKSSDEVAIVLRSVDNEENGNMRLAELTIDRTGLSEQEIENRIRMMLQVFETGDINIDTREVEDVLSVSDIKDNSVAFPMGRIEGIGYILTYPENKICMRILPQN